MLVRPREEKGRLAFTLHLSAWYPNQHGLSLVNNSQEYHRSRAISERSTSTRHRLRWRGRGQPCPATTLSIMSCTGTIHMQMCSTTSKSHTFCSPVGNSSSPGCIACSVSDARSLWMMMATGSTTIFTFPTPCRFNYIGLVRQRTRFKFRSIEFIKLVRTCFWRASDASLFE